MDVQGEVIGVYRKCEGCGHWLSVTSLTWRWRACRACRLPLGRVRVDRPRYRTLTITDKGRAFLRDAAA